jgi:hypothetical protein
MAIKLIAGGLAAVLAAALQPAYSAETQQEPQVATEESGGEAAGVTKAEATEAANTFARCAGYFKFMAEMATLAEKPAQAEYIHMLANGAESAAAHWLATQYALENKDGPPRTYGSFYVVFKGVVEGALAHNRALAEAGDIESIRRQGRLCDELLPMQEEIVQSIRSGFSEDAAPKPADKDKKKVQ